MESNYLRRNAIKTTMIYIFKSAWGGVQPIEKVILGLNSLLVSVQIIVRYVYQQMDSDLDRLRHTIEPILYDTFPYQ